jgi:uncharacterized protein involved in type VI secretion and phage assembly
VPTTTNLRAQTSPFWIKVDGSELPPGDAAGVIDIAIEQDLVLPDAFTIRIRDTEDRGRQREQLHCRLLDEDRFPIGGAIEIGLGLEERATSVLKGEIASLELEVRADGGPQVTVRGYDRAQRLHRERKSRAFRNVTDSDLVSQIGREYGLAAQVDSTREVHEHVVQDNQSDWEFLRARADRVGFELFLVDNKLQFRKPAADERPIELEFGTTLQRLRLRLSAPSQVEEVLVKGWDPASKREIVGQAGRPSHRARIGEQRPGADLARRLGNGRFVLSNQPVRTQREAELLAQSVLDDLAGEFIQLEGSCLGEVRLAPGQPVALKNLGRRFDGTYYLSAATHRVTREEGYTTRFVVSGRRPLTLSALLSGGGQGRGRRSAANGGGGSQHAGVAVGLVTNNKDAERGGRVKVRFPWLSQDESHWARLASPMAGAERGFYFLPEVGDEVLVAFEQGDINHPYVVGGLWNGREKPPKPADQVVGPTGKVNQRIIRSRLGHTITLDDSDDKPSITVVDKTGQNTIKLDSTTNTLSATVQGDLSLTARGKVKVEGATVEVAATTGGLALKGATLDAEARGPLGIKGSVVNIN